MGSVAGPVKAPALDPDGPDLLPPSTAEGRAVRRCVVASLGKGFAWIVVGGTNLKAGWPNVDAAFAWARGCGLTATWCFVGGEASVRFYRVGSASE